MFSTGIFGTLEDLGYGARNQICGMFSGSLGTGSTALKGYCNGEINEKIPYGGSIIHDYKFILINAGDDIGDQVDALIDELDNKNSRINESIKYIRSRTTASNLDFDKYLFDIISNEYPDPDKKDDFLKLFLSKANQSGKVETHPVPTDDMDIDKFGKILGMSRDLIKLLKQVSKGEVTEDEFVKIISGGNIDTNISYDLKDVLLNGNGAPVDGSTKPEPAKKTMDLKSLLMETEIGQKLFEHV